MMQEQLIKIINDLEIPIIPKESKVWFVRTQSGNYYRDFYFNDFVALGWDKIPFEMINNFYSNRDTLFL